MTVGVCLLIILFCLLIQAFFAASEMALISAGRLRVSHLADSGNKQAGIIQRLLQYPERFLATTLVGTNITLVLGATVASYLASQILGLTDSGPFIATIVMLPLILIFGEIVPKTLARGRATDLSLAFSYPLQFSYYLLYPVVKAVSWLSTRLLGLVGFEAGEEKLFSSVEDIRLLMEKGEEEGALTEDERKMISRVFDFGESEITDIIIPLIDVTLAKEDSKVKDIWWLVKETGYSRIPIFRERVDKIIGTVQATDLIMASGEGGIKEFIREPYIVPESKPLEELLEELRHNDVNMAIVADEYGGVAGIVTLENIIEEIVGEIRDEYDPEGLSEFRLRGDVADVSGRMRVDELNKVLGLELPEEESETIAGFITDLLGKIPDIREKIKHGENFFTVTRATDRRIIRLEIGGPVVAEKIAKEREKKERRKEKI